MSDGAGAAGCDQSRWENWAGDVVVERPWRHCRPTTLAELVDIVTRAEAETPPREVRACGGRWSLADVARTPDCIVETEGLRATLRDVVPAALTDAVRDALVQRTGRWAGSNLVHVEAGVTIGALNLRLDRQPPPDDEQWRAFSTDGLPGPVGDARARWALPTMPGGSGQTVAGAISTATHGGDHAIPPLADAVLAIHLVTTGGRQLWIERSEPLTDADRLAAALPDVTPVYDTELFDAALVAVGRMGIVYAVVLEVVEQFSLEQRTTATTWAEQEARCRAPFPVLDESRPGTVDPSEFTELVLLPYAAPDGSRPCYVTQRWRGPDDVRRPVRGPDLLMRLRQLPSVAPVLVAVLALGVVVGAVGLLLPAPGWLRRIVTAVGAVVTVAGLVLLLVAGRKTVGEFIAGALNLANRLGQSWLVRKAGAAVIRAGRPLAPVRDVGYEVADLDWSSRDSIRADSVEVAFDAASGAHLDYLREDLFPTFDRFAADGTTTAGLVSLRFTRRSTGLLAMQRWDPTCSIEVAFLQGIDGNLEILQALQDAAVQRGGTVHWGQFNTLTREQVERAFPAIGAWRGQLARGLGTGGTDVFGNEFCRRRGLEP